MASMATATTKSVRKTPAKLTSNNSDIISGERAGAAEKGFLLFRSKVKWG